MTPGTGGQLNYGFDASGNLTTLPTSATGTYDDAGELTSAALSGATTSYNYNADGERLTAKQGSATVASGTWNGAGQLTAYSDPSASMSAATYDGTGLRASATTTPTGGAASTQNFVWDATTQVPDLLMDSGNAYIYGTTGALAEQLSISPAARLAIWSPTVSGRYAALSAQQGISRRPPPTMPGATPRRLVVLPAIARSGLQAGTPTPLD